MNPKPKDPWAACLEEMEAQSDYYDRTIIMTDSQNLKDYYEYKQDGMDEAIAILRKHMPKSQPKKGRGK